MVGAWVAISPMASSFRTRLRGTSRVWASCSRHAATSIKTASSFGFRTRVFSRSHGAFRMDVVCLGRGEDLHLLADPFAAASLFEVGIEGCEDIAQVGDIGDRVLDLILGQWTLRPVRKAVGLVGAVARDPLHQLVIGDRVSVAEHHGGDLGVEHRMRHDIGAMPDDFDVLPRRVEDLEDLFVAHQFEEGRQVDAFGQGIDHDSFLRARHLDDAEQRVIGRLAQKLGVDGDDGVLGESVADGGEFACC